MGCTIIGCRDSHLLACGQWIQCPFEGILNIGDRNCSYAPDVVCNSWGGGNDDTWYDDVINSWQSAGIIPVFAIGNSGPLCKTANSPGDRPNVIAVGNTEINDRIAASSSLGPTGDGRIKPEISAPGTDVYSASHFTDDKYTPMTGTSMAAPHVTGVIALMKSKTPTATYSQVYNAIITNPITNLDMTHARTCGDIAPNSFPNNVFGYGRIDAMNAVDSV
jgi:subtilisin family serine protease